MTDSRRRLTALLAETGALFFADDLRLKDGRPTPYFVNVGAFHTGRLVLEMGRGLAAMIHRLGFLHQIDVIVGPSYKGSALAVAAAVALWDDFQRETAFDYDRQQVKMHGEATGKGAGFVTGALTDGARLFIVDDVASSMATKLDLCQKLADEEKKKGIRLKIVGVGICLDREQTTAVYDDQGRVVEGRRGDDAKAAFTAKTGLPVHSMLRISEVIETLYQDQTPVLISGRRQPISPDIKARFDQYQKTYGPVA
jgi:orotate phosphoribosyltransferase